MLKILDFVPDEKFIDSVFKLNDTIKDSEIHTYILIIKDKTKGIKYIKNLSYLQILTSKEAYAEIKSGNYDAIFFHGLSSVPLSFYRRLNFNIPLFWFSWGYDIYILPHLKPFVPINLLHEETTKFRKDSLKKKLFNLPHLFIDYGKKFKELYLCNKVITQFDFHSGILPYETELIRSYNPKFQAKQVQYSYGNPYQSYEFIPAKGHNVLIGNSGSESNNHLDLIPFLQKKGLDDYKLVVPLSYGGTKKYISSICTAYSKEFGDRFIPLKDYVPLEEYLRLTDNCSIAIFYLERQQAMGNIFQSLRLGRKVFLSKTSAVYQYLKDLGYRIFTIQEDLIKDDALELLPIEDQKHNYDLWSIGQKKWIKDRENIRSEISNWHLSKNSH